MEAWRFGFIDTDAHDAATSSGYKFDPTDADIVVSYLLPRALGLGLDDVIRKAVIEDDVISLSPWELLEKHGHAGSRHAFFITTVADAGRKSRTVKDEGGRAVGKWHGQNGEDGRVTLVSPDGRELDIEYRQYDLTYKRTGVKKPAGYVMHEFEITSPPLPHTLLYRIKKKRNKKQAKQGQQAEAAAPADEADEQELSRIRTSQIYPATGIKLTSSVTARN